MTYVNLEMQTNSVANIIMLVYHISYQNILTDLILFTLIGYDINL